MGFRVLSDLISIIIYLFYFPIKAREYAAIVWEILVWLLSMSSRLLFGTMGTNRVFVAYRSVSLSRFVIEEFCTVFMLSTAASPPTPTSPESSAAFLGHPRLHYWDLSMPSILARAWTTGPVRIAAALPWQYKFGSFMYEPLYPKMEHPLLVMMRLW
jgi:hypothetical protein